MTSNAFAGIVLARLLHRQHYVVIALIITHMAYMLSHN